SRSSGEDRQADLVAHVDVRELEVGVSRLRDVELVAGRRQAVALAEIACAGNAVDPDVIRLGIPVAIVVDAVRPRLIDHSIAVVVDAVSGNESPARRLAFRHVRAAPPDAFITESGVLYVLVAEVPGGTSGGIGSTVGSPRTCHVEATIEEGEVVVVVARTSNVRGAPHPEADAFEVLLALVRDFVDEE